MLGILRGASRLAIKNRSKKGENFGGPVSSRRESDKKGIAPVYITITIHYKYIKLINRLTLDPHPEKIGALSRAH